VVIGEDDYLVRHGIERALDTQPDIELAASCGDLESLRAAIDSHEPDVVLTDIRMPPSMSDEGLRVAAELADERPDVGVVVLSQYDEPEYVLAFLDRGAAGRAYLLKEKIADVAELTSAVRAVHGGGSMIDPQVVERLVVARSRRRSPLETLTVREREVLELMARGMSNSGIAAELGIGSRSVEKHVGSIFPKLALDHEDTVNRRVLAVLFFLSEIG